MPEQPQQPVAGQQAAQREDGEILAAGALYYS